jgi:hypothetical protein
MSAEAFTIQTKHSLVNCTKYAFCSNVGVATSEWGLQCKTCTRNKYAQNITGDNYIPKTYIPNAPPKQTTPVDSLKDLVIAEVLDKLSNLDERTLKAGATVFLQVNLKTQVIDVAVIDNIVEAEKCLSKAKEHIQKITALFSKTTTPEVEGPTCFRCGKPLPEPGWVTCPACSFDNSAENIRKYDGL